MELRTEEYYKRQPSFIRYSLLSQDPKSPEAGAVMIAIANKKNVKLKPDIKVRIYGQVGNPSPSNPNIKSHNWVTTSYIKSIFFERVHDGEQVSLHCYARTQNSTYFLWEEGRLAELEFLLEDLDERDLKFEDFREFYDYVNTDYEEVKIINP